MLWIKEYADPHEKTHLKTRVSNHDLLFRDKNGLYHCFSNQIYSQPL